MLNRRTGAEHARDKWHPNGVAAPVNSTTNLSALGSSLESQLTCVEQSIAT